MPFFAVAAVALWRGRASTWVWLVDYAALIAGGSLQGQFAYVGAAVHNLASYPEPAWVPGTLSLSAGAYSVVSCAVVGLRAGRLGRGDGGKRHTQRHSGDPTNVPIVRLLPVPSTGTDVFWGINVALAVVPLLIFLRGRALAVTATHDRRDTKDD